jgi:DNA polymerase-3 subunit beta
MKIIVSKSSLEAAVKNLIRVINPKNTLPILGDILFDVNETANTERLTASDSEVTLISEVILNECEGLCAILRQ